MGDRWATRISLLALNLFLVAPAGLAAATTTSPPPDTSFLRAQAEAELLAAFPDSTGVACAVPPADEAGVQFRCYATSADGTVIARVATVNDDGGIQFGDAAAPATTTTVPAPPVAGSGSDNVAVTPFSGPTIVAVTHDGAGEFAVQAQQGGVAVGPPIVVATGAVAGRFLTGLEGRVESLAVTADGSWTIQVEPISTALPLTADAPVSAAGPDVVRFATVEAAPATITFDGAGPFAVSAVTSAGSQALVAETGPYGSEVSLPAGPGYLAVNGSGAWSITLGADATTDTAAG